MNVLNVYATSRFTDQRIPGRLLCSQTVKYHGVAAHQYLILYKCQLSFGCHVYSRIISLRLVIHQILKLFYRNHLLKLQLRGVCGNCSVWTVFARP